MEQGLWCYFLCWTRRRCPSKSFTQHLLPSDRSSSSISAPLLPHCPLLHFPAQFLGVYWLWCISLQPLQWSVLCFHLRFSYSCVRDRRPTSQESFTHRCCVSYLGIWERRFRARQHPTQNLHSVYVFDFCAFVSLRHMHLKEDCYGHEFTDWCRSRRPSASSTL